MKNEWLEPIYKNTASTRLMMYILQSATGTDHQSNTAKAYQ